MQRRRALMMGGKKARLPSGFREVKWIESTGTQYINTGMLTSNALEISAKAFNTFGKNTNGSYGAMLFGGRITNRSSNVSYSSGANNDFVGNGNEFLAIPKNNNVELLTINWKKTGVQIKCGNYEYNSVLNAQIITQRPIYIFGCNQNGTLEQSGTYKGVEFVFVVNGENSRVFVPCYREADNKPGMYDLCGSICPLTNSPFYINAGTGEFLVGPEVN